MKPSIKAYAPCERPITLKKMDIEEATGEIVFDGVVEKRCGTRRKDVCEPCSEMWSDDAYFALMKGAENFAGGITFITLTPPGSGFFGRTHRAAYSKKRSERCACKKYHEKSDEVVGTPVNSKKYDHSKVATFNHSAPRLTAVTLQKIWRLLSTEMGQDVEDVRMPIARVMEWQHRGLLHVHIIVLGVIPTYIVEWAVHGRSKSESGSRRSVSAATHNGMRWGEQIDVSHISSSDMSQRKRLNSYVTKVVNYAIKDVRQDSNKAYGPREAYLHEIRKHTDDIIKCDSRWAHCRNGHHDDERLKKIDRQSVTPPPRCRKHRRGRHQLGFTGNVLSLNRSWGASLGDARQARVEHARKAYQQTATAVCLDTEKKLITQVQFLGAKRWHPSFIVESPTARTVGEVVGLGYPDKNGDGNGISSRHPQHQVHRHR